MEYLVRKIIRYLIITHPEWHIIFKQLIGFNNYSVNYIYNEYY